MAEIQRRNKKTGQVGIFDSNTKQFLRWADEPKMAQSQSEEPSFGDAALVSGLQSATFGLSDELIGALETPGRLLEERKTGESFLDKIGRIYKEQRDLERANIKHAEEEAPMGSLVGTLAGGFAMPGAWLAKGGLAASKSLPMIAETAPNLVKALQSPVGKMVTGGAEAGALMGLGTSEKEDLSGMLSDTYSGLKTGGVLGGGLGVAGMGIAKAAPILQKLMPKSEGVLARSYQKGREGIDILAPEFEQGVSQRIKQEAGDLSQMLGGEQKAIQETIETGEKEAFKTLEKTRSSVNDKLDDIQKNTSDYLENQTQIQKAANKNLQEKLQKDLEKKALQLQKDVDDVRVKLGKEYDTIDDMAAKAGVQVDTTPVINNIIDELNTTGLTENAVKAISKKFEPEYGKVDFQQFQSLKRKLQELFDHADPMVRGIAKKSYGKMSEAFEKTLRSNGLNDLADQIAHTNRRWGIYANMDDFVQGTRVQKPFDQRFAEPKTIRTIEKLGLPEAESISMKKQLEARLPEIMPETAPTRLQEMTKLSQDIEAANKAKPMVPTLDESLGQNKEYQKLQEMLDELKGVKVKALDKLAPETQKVRDIIKEVHGEEAAEQFMNALSQMEVPAQKSFIQQFGTTPESVKKKLLSLIPQTGEKFGSFAKQQELEDLLKVFGQKHGPEKAEKLQGRLEELAKDIELGRSVQGSSFGSESFTRPGAIKAAAGGGFTTAGTKIANVVGMSVHDFLNSTPGKLLEMATKSSNKVIQDILKQAGTRDKAGRQALLFTLMQNPAYREYIQAEPEEK